MRICRSGFEDAHCSGVARKSANSPTTVQRRSQPSMVAVWTRPGTDARQAARALMGVMCRQGESVRFQGQQNDLIGREIVTLLRGGGLGAFGAWERAKLNSAIPLVPVATCARNGARGPKEQVLEKLRTATSSVVQPEAANPNRGSSAASMAAPVVILAAATRLAPNARKTAAADALPPGGEGR